MPAEGVGDDLLELLPAEPGEVAERALTTEPRGPDQRVDDGGQRYRDDADAKREQDELHGHGGGDGIDLTHPGRSTRRRDPRS